MALKDRFEQTKRQDPRIIELDVAKRNYFRSNTGSFRDTVESVQVFEVMRELLLLNPDLELYENGLDTLPVLIWESDDYMGSIVPVTPMHIPDGPYCLRLSINFSADLIHKAGDVSEGWSVEVDWRNGSHTNLIAQEIIPVEEVTRESLEEAVVGVLKLANYDGITPGRIDYVNLDPEGHFAAIGLHPNAFEGLSKEEAEDLINKNYKVRAKKYHPDKSGDEQKMKDLNNARDFFMDPKNRRK